MTLKFWYDNYFTKLLESARKLVKKNEKVTINI